MAAGKESHVCHSIKKKKKKRVQRAGDKQNWLVNVNLIQKLGHERDSGLF
jgi:hypothetical protein